MDDNTSVNIDHLAIKAVCVIGFINATQMVHLILSPMTKQIGAFFPTYFLFSVVISLICLLGLWFLKKWAAVTYTITLLCNQVVLIKMGYWEVTALIMPAVIVFLIYHSRKEIIH